MDVIPKVVEYLLVYNLTPTIDRYIEGTLVLIQVLEKK